MIVIIMGLFNWIFKGVNVESREVANAKVAASAVNLPEGLLAAPDASTFGDQVQQSHSSNIPVSEPVSQSQPYASESAQRAASILFERSENLNFNNIGSNNMYGSNSQYGASQQSFSSALNGQNYGNRNILVLTPRTNVEVTEIVANLKKGEACIVCLEGLDATDAQRRLDFLSGVICAENGTIKRLNPNTYILTPSGIGVR